MSEETNTEEEVIYYDQRSVALRTPQSIYFVEEHDKVAMLGELMNMYKEKQVVIVVKSKKKADALSAFLLSKDFKALSVHGNHREEQQTKAAKDFKDATLNTIITTDMILKDLELQNIQLIVNFDLPQSAQYYYNRLAFMKEQGTSIALIGKEDEYVLDEIEYNMKVEIEEKTLEGFKSTDKPKHSSSKKDRTKKPRHRKNKVKKDTET
jgi:ATP-dependent RNA helicase RhlE